MILTPMTSTGTPDEHCFLKMVLRNNSTCMMLPSLLKFTRGSQCFTNLKFTDTITYNHKRSSKNIHDSKRMANSMYEVRPSIDWRRVVLMEKLWTRIKVVTYGRFCCVAASHTEPCTGLCLVSSR